MALKRSTFVILFFCLLGGSVFAQQQKQPDIFKDADGNTYHQLFLDFKATELLKLNYTLMKRPWMECFQLMATPLLLKIIPVTNR
ncbi:MAG: hypothetical protein IPL22_07360 [Bacteroidetes bacterium]|nr:hypothetical protein [Bacteroidota bacterium]